tara:strand:- start:628 stop:1080 length:453 start_codon:yes stop_codon:yes gene_type:complete
MKDLRDQLVWLPVGTHKTTMLSDHPAEHRLKFEHKKWIHEGTFVGNKRVFLILEVKGEEAVIGDTENQQLLGAIMKTKTPKTMQINTMELLRLFSEEADELDERLKASIVLRQPTCALGESEAEIFFYSVCRFLKDSIYSEAACTNKPSQ